jgi:hypothetical protein
VVLDSAAGPVVVQVLVGCNAHLLGEVDDHRAGDLLLRPRKAPVVPEHLEQYDEAQLCWARLVGQQHQLVRCRRSNNSARLGLKCSENSVLRRF